MINFVYELHCNENAIFFLLFVVLIFDRFLITNWSKFNFIGSFLLKSKFM